MFDLSRACHSNRSIYRRHRACAIVWLVSQLVTAGALIFIPNAAPMSWTHVITWDALCLGRPISWTPYVWDALFHGRPMSWTPYVMDALCLGRPISWTPYVWDALFHGRPMSWTPYVMDTYVLDALCLGRPMSWTPYVMDALCLGRPMSGTPYVLDALCLGRPMSWTPYVWDALYRGRPMSGTPYVWDALCLGHPMSWTPYVLDALCHALCHGRPMSWTPVITHHVYPDDWSAQFNQIAQNKVKVITERLCAQIHHLEAINCIYGVARPWGNSLYKPTPMSKKDKCQNKTSYAQPTSISSPCASHLNDTWIISDYMQYDMRQYDMRPLSIEHIVLQYKFLSFSFLFMKTRLRNGRTKVVCVLF